MIGSISGRADFLSDFLGVDFMQADGFDEAIIGVAERAGQEPILAYDREACIKVLMSRDGMSLDVAEEYFEFNVVGAYVGDLTPIFITVSHESE
tara:strand:- start:322 stop:603 length:282 start_codon:yes stop_codon:yes gene_type:complete